MTQYPGDQSLLRRGKVEVKDGITVRHVPKGTVNKLVKGNPAAPPGRTAAFEVSRWYGKFNPRHPMPKNQPEYLTPLDPDQTLISPSRGGRGFTLVNKSRALEPLRERVCRTGDTLPRLGPGKSYGE